MKNNQNSYTKDSIQSLSPLEFVRLRPSVYCGSIEYSTQLLVELFANSTDEFQIGNAHNIIINSFPNYTYELSDDGQGILPNILREDGKTIFEAVLGQLNTSGKYNSDGVYEGNVNGVNGIGLKLVTFLSHWVEGLTWRDGKYERIWFKEGQFEKRETGKWTEKSNPHGTKIIWQPNEKFFVHPEVEDSRVKELIQSTVCLCQGLTVKFNNETYFSYNGIDDLIDSKNEILKNRLRIKYQNGKHKLDLSLTYTNSYSSSIVSYVNTGFTTSGPHITQIKTILTREMNRFFREKKWLKEKDDNLSGDDCQEGLKLVFHLITTDIGYDGQLKDRIVKIDMSPFTSIITDELRNWLTQNEKEIKVIADKALNARKAREAARKAKEAVRQPKEKKRQFLNLPTKLVDCWGKDRSKCELVISEGDSAASGLVEGRNAEFVAVFPIRGKIISSYKNSSEKIFANQEVVNLIKALGLELDPKTNKLIYDEKKLRYGKIMLAMDADSDGASIRNLLIEMFWWLCPEIIEHGHLYTTMPPLFRITTKKNEYIFLKDNNALEEYKKAHQGEDYLVNRNKGLGEQDASELAEALLNPETRNVAQLTISDAKATAELIEILLGPSVPPRREYLLKHEMEANEDE